MKRNKAKRLVCMGVVCALLVMVSAWYTVAYNDSRLIAPMDWTEYAFRARDLPMIISGALLTLYLLYLFFLLGRAIIANKGKAAEARFTRTLNPKLGFLGFLGFAGFLGFWTYSADKTVFPFIFFTFFGYFGFFYEGKMSNILMDERYRENRMKAHMKANQTALKVIFFAAIILCQGWLIGSLEYSMIALLIVVALSVALSVFLSEYLLFRYDHDESEGGE